MHDLRTLPISRNTRVRQLATLGLAMAMLSLGSCAGSSEPSSTDPGRNHGPPKPSTSVIGTIPMGSVSDQTTTTSMVTLADDDPVARLLFMASCVEGEGFALTLDLEEVSWTAQVPPEQQSRFQQVMDKCIAEAEEKGLIPGTPTDDEIAEYFERQVRVHDCLIENGYPSQDPPSLERYRDQWLGVTGAPWDPYGMVASELAADPHESQSDWDRIAELCPPG